MMNMEVMSVHSETDDPNGEGVWSPEIEQAFQEALKLFPPCGRRKHILQEEGGGKMYGRNELIARYIEQKTGHRRTRKQVSSHIQVLSRREARSKASSRGGDTDSVSPASSITASSLGGSSSPSNNVNMAPVGMSLADHRGQARANSYCDVWADRPIVTAKIRLVEFSAFIEHWHPASSSSLEPITDLVLAANANNGHQAMNSTGSQQGLPMQIDSNGQQPRTPLMANNHLTQTGQTPHHLTAGSNQFNHSLQSINAIYTNPYQTLQQSNGQQTPLNYNQQHYQQMNQRNAEANNLMLSATANPMMLNYPHRTMASNTSNGVTRHSYVKIDYRMPVQRHFSKLERIDISQIQDKFPDIGGPKGLYQGSDPDAFFLIKFWADMKNDLEYNNADQRAYVGSSCHFETIEPLKSIICCTKACSYGLQVVEKVEKLYGSFNSANGRYSYDIDRSELCEFMTQFIKKLRQLPLVSQMNSVLENFTVLQVVTNEATAEILLCLAFVFEIDDQSNGSQYHVYKLTKD